MAEMNQEHLRIIAEVMGYDHRKGMYGLQMDLPEALAAMQRLQEQIDQLKKENEQLKKVPDSQLSPLGYAIRHSINAPTPTFKISEDNKPSNPDSQ